MPQWNISTHKQPRACVYSMPTAQWHVEPLLSLFICWSLSANSLGGFFIRNSLFTASLSLNACSVNQWPTCPKLHPHPIHVWHEGSRSLFEWALHWTGQEISKGNFIKPPQIRGSKKMGPLKMRLSLKESINLVLDIREGMSERETEIWRTSDNW